MYIYIYMYCLNTTYPFGHHHSNFMIRGAPWYKPVRAWVRGCAQVHQLSQRHYGDDPEVMSY